MCDAAAIPAGLAALQVVGSQQEAKAQQAAGEMKAAILERNAQVSEVEARDAIARGSVEEQKSRLDTSRTIGTQRTAYAASGVRVDSGSALDVMGSTAGAGELTAQTIRSNAAREAWGFEQEAVNSRLQAKLARMGAQYASDASLITGYTRAAATIANYRRG